MVTKWLLIILLISGCGSIDRANRHLKKAEKHLQRAVALGADVKKPDTVFVDRNFIIKEVKHDTILKNVNFRDTIRLETERIAWKVKVNTVDREVYVEGKCKSDTVKIEVPVSVAPPEISAGYSLWDLIILAIILFIAGVFLSPLIKKLLK